MLSDSCWGFAAPHSTSATNIKEIGENTVALVQGDQAIIVSASKNLKWDNEHSSFSVDTRVAPDAEIKIYFTFSIGSMNDALKQCFDAARNPEAAIKSAYGTYDQLVSRTL